MLGPLGNPRFIESRPGEMRHSFRRYEKVSHVKALVCRDLGRSSLKLSEYPLSRSYVGRCHVSPFRTHSSVVTPSLVLSLTPETCSKLRAQTSGIPDRELTSEYFREREEITSVRPSSKERVLFFVLRRATGPLRNRRTQKVTMIWKTEIEQKVTGPEIVKRNQKVDSY